MMTDQRLPTCVEGEENGDRACLERPLTLSHRGLAAAETGLDRGGLARPLSERLQW